MGLELEDIARIQAEIDKGADLTALLRDAAISEDAFRTAKMQWLEAMANDLDRGEGAIVQRYAAAFLTVRGEPLSEEELQSREQEAKAASPPPVPRPARTRPTAALIPDKRPRAMTLEIDASEPAPASQSLPSFLAAAAPNQPRMGAPVGQPLPAAVGSSFSAGSTGDLSEGMAALSALPFHDSPSFYEAPAVYDATPAPAPVAPIAAPAPAAPPAAKAQVPEVFKGTMLGLDLSAMIQAATPFHPAADRPPSESPPAAAPIPVRTPSSPAIPAVQVPSASALPSYAAMTMGPGSGPLPLPVTPFVKTEQAAPRPSSGVMAAVQVPQAPVGPARSPSTSSFVAMTMGPGGGPVPQPATPFQPTAPAARPPLNWTLENYASLTVDLGLHPPAEVLARYRINVEDQNALDAYWHTQLVDPQLRKRFFDASERYRASQIPRR